MIALEEIKDRFMEVESRIAAAALRAGRSSREVKLVVVTKSHPVQTIRAVVEAGARYLGENYADQAVPKIEALGDLEDVEWHMIGHVQSRKSRLVAENFDMVHSLDSVKLARRLNDAIRGTKPMPVLVQVNVSGETQKFGIPAWTTGSVSAVASVMQEVLELEHLRLCGLMTIPPYLPEEEVRPHFKRLVELRDELEQHIHGLQLPELSMGMSGDFEAAVEEGATLVRVGTAILGPR